MKYINKYNYRPNFVFHKVNNEEDLYMGVELEVDMGGENDENAKGILDILNDNNKINAYCMHDGSLTGGNIIQGYGVMSTGFEIATMPCTLEYHKQLPYKEAFKFLIDKGYKSHDTKTCGMHVHINRNYFGNDKLVQDLNISKLMFLFEKYWQEIVLIARRDSNRYARRSFLEENESVIDLYSKSKQQGKYAVINLEHKDTVEIRIFKGTLNYDTYMCTLEFVYDICKLVKNVDIYVIQMVKWDDIESTFSDNLIKYLNTRREIERQAKEKKLESINSNYFYRSIPPLENCYFNIDSLTLTPDSNNESQRELTEEEKLRKEIKKIKKQIKRVRNELEKLNLRRKLSELENELRGLIRNTETITNLHNCCEKALRSSAS